MDENTMMLVVMGRNKGFTDDEVCKMVEELGFEETRNRIVEKPMKEDNPVGSQILDKLMETASAANPMEDGDYEKDGLIYCGKCNTPKQCVIEVLGAVKKPMIPCKCRKEQLKREEEEASERARADRLLQRKQDGFADAEMRNWTFDHDDGANERLSVLSRRYVDKFEDVRHRKRNGLLLFGSIGTGKTFMAACIANALIEKGYRCLVTNFPRLINTIQSSDDRQGYLDSLNDYDLLVIDDFASERNTEYMDENVFNVIDQRERNGKPLIVTTNLTGKELKDASNMRKARVYSRLLDLCFPFEVSGSDRRRESLKDDYDELNELYGLKEGMA